MGAGVMAEEQRVRVSGKYNKKRAVKGTAPKCLGAVRPLTKSKSAVWELFQLKQLRFLQMIIQKWK